MSFESLEWIVCGEQKLLSTPVFDVLKQAERPVSAGECPAREYIAMDAPDWAIVIPYDGENCIMVRQWRHAAQALTLEFPGGDVEKGEDPRDAAMRELEEETGCRAEKVTFLGKCSPNPALFRNTVHFYLAEGLVLTGSQHLDEDERVNYVTVPVSDVMKGFASGEYIHAFTGTALALFLRHKNTTD